MNSIVEQYMIEGSMYKKLQNQNQNQNQINFEIGPAKTLQKKRTSNFREDETQLLIHLWGNPSIQNKLYLTHRKAPVMRTIAASMQEKGYNRTPDEIKTRIRNLKCLYHRIKRTVSSGTGIGTVDIDWPHYEAMDRILNKQNPEHYSYKGEDYEIEQGEEMDYKDYEHDRSDTEYNIDEPTIEIKEELPDYVDNDEGVEYIDDSPNENYPNDSNDEQYNDHSDYESPSLKSLIPTIIMKQSNSKIILPKDSPQSHSRNQTPQPLVIQVPTQTPTKQPQLQLQQQKVITVTTATLPQTQTTTQTYGTVSLQHPPALQMHQGHKMPSISIQTTMPTNNLTTATSVNNNNMSSIPLPLLILNGVHPKKPDGSSSRAIHESDGITLSNGLKTSAEDYSSLHGILKDILQVQKDNLDLEKQKNESERQRLEIEKEKIVLEKEKLEYNKIISEELLKLTPMMYKLYEAVATTNTISNDDGSNGMKKKNFSVLRSALEQK